MYFNFLQFNWNIVFPCFADLDEQPSEPYKFTNGKHSSILNKNVTNIFTANPENYQGTNKFQNKNNFFKKINAVVFKAIVKIVSKQS